MIIPFSGSSRILQLQAVLASLRAQDMQDFEILIPAGREIVDHLKNSVSANVRFVPSENPGTAYCKSRHINKAVAAARAQSIMLHDADILVPTCYVRRVAEILENGWDAVHPIRLLFYLEEADTERFLAGRYRVSATRILEVRQNFAGGSIALTREAFARIGGMNEDFVGWGREDVEFLQRASTTKMFKGRFVPAIHLWHPAQRDLVTNPNSKRLEGLQDLSIQERIQMLREARKSE